LSAPRRGWRLLFVALAVVGCRGAELPDRADEPDRPGAAAQAPAVDQDPRAWGVEHVRGGDGERGVATLTTVRTARHDGYDRVVFEFDTHVPGYGIAYESRPVVACGSGHDVPLPDGAPLVARFTPARAHDELGRATVTDRERTLDLPALRDLRVFCDFEAHLDWAVTVGTRQPFAVTLLDSPPRLVLDVRQP
jgi:hypothetical protein